MLSLITAEPRGGRRGGVARLEVVLSLITAELKSLLMNPLNCLEVVLSLITAEHSRNCHS